MPITSTTQQPIILSAKVVIDWAELQKHGQGQNVEALIDWVRNYPNASNVHVVLGGYRNHHGARKLQGRLQALGCRVIARHVARKS